LEVHHLAQFIWLQSVDELNSIQDYRPQIHLAPAMQFIWTFHLDKDSKIIKSV